MFCTILLTLLLAPAGAAAQSMDHARIVEAFAAAFNARDVDAMLALAHDDIEWLSVDGAKVSVETAGKDALRQSMTAYFESCPTCRSEVEITGGTAVRLAVVETASWTAASGRRSQKSLAIYEFADGRIRRVSYYPAER